MAPIVADQYLDKNLSKYLPSIEQNLTLLNNYLDSHIEHDTELYHFLITVSYQYYRLKDQILSTHH
ncbi:hypothetical protein MuYL_3034 [Mucilaginibacter xinganensis]|uniref:Uncharacterized protein n=2 Tax=Mucilaginibacter xinganensis TaxID=1234841 RepID=A0A223NYF8_9SPHI|nr:hypothetical protein MuYL_3034 [Mucilaginibacter xinganensis]